jgi:hypothetical protein
LQSFLRDAVEKSAGRIKDSVALGEADLLANTLRGSDTD